MLYLAKGQAQVKAVQFLAPPVTHAFNHDGSETAGGGLKTSTAEVENILHFHCILVCAFSTC
jgi:hypothetical protein